MQSSKYFNFRTFKYHPNIKVNLLRTNLESYIQHFLPHWNEHIIEHYVTIGKQNLYCLTICFSIGVIMKDETPGVISMRHNDHMNQVYCDYIINELNSVVKYIIDDTNMKIKNDIISNKHLIDVIGYLGYNRECIDFFSSNPELRKPYDYMYLKQKNIINVLKLYNIPTEFKTIDYIRCIDRFIKYIYFKIEEYYNTQNMKIEHRPIRSDIYNIRGEQVYFISLFIEL